MDATVICLRQRAVQPSDHQRSRVGLVPGDATQHQHDVGVLHSQRARVVATALREGGAQRRPLQDLPKEAARRRREHALRTVRLQGHAALAQRRFCRLKCLHPPGTGSCVVFCSVPAATVVSADGPFH